VDTDRILREYYAGLDGVGKLVLKYVVTRSMFDMTVDSIGRIPELAGLGISPEVKKLLTELHSDMRVELARLDDQMPDTAEINKELKREGADGRGDAVNPEGNGLDTWDF
jgi:hypothetical protein